MTAIHTDRRHTRRGFLARVTRYTGGLAGLGLLSRCYLERAHGVSPDPNVQRYDAFLKIYYTGGPSQTDTWDPKPGTPHNVFDTLALEGIPDRAGDEVRVSAVFGELGRLLASDARFGLGIVRSMTHGNAVHPVAQDWTHCFWQNALARDYPGQEAVWAHYFADQVETVPSVLITAGPRNSIVGGNGAGANELKGARIPTALAIGDSASAGELFTLPLDAERYERSQRLTELFDQGYGRPDHAVQAWRDAVKQAHALTIGGEARAAFDLESATLLGAGSGVAQGIREDMTTAQELLKAGVPAVSIAIPNNDSHNGNVATVQRNWGATDRLLSELARNVADTGKRVLVLLGGEFGRTPETVASGRDGRDHHARGFSWTLLSINQPGFVSRAVGDTGPLGMYGREGAPPLIDAVTPAAVGTLVYRALGFNVGADPAYNIPTRNGSQAPVPSRIANSKQPGGGAWLMEQFGLG